MQKLQLGRAAIFNGQGLPFELITRKVPALKRGEILVRVLYTTICGSDVHTYCGRRQEPPHVVLGHEIVGEIISIEAAHPGRDSRHEDIKPGDRIAWSIFSVPENIKPLREDIPQKSHELFKYGHALAEGDDIFNGGFADYCILKSNTACIKIDQSMPLPVAATISCAHATVMGALRVAGSVSGKKILIVGAGLLGLSCLAMCREAGAYWIGITDIDPTRLQWSRDFGANEQFVYQVDENNHFPWPSVDVVFDMTGNAQAMKTGTESLTIGGVAVWIGAVFPTDPVLIDGQRIVRNLLQIRGLHNYNYEDFVNAASFIELNYTKYPFELLVEKEFPLEEIDLAFAYAHEKKPIRVGIKVFDSSMPDDSDVDEVAISVNTSV